MESIIFSDGACSGNPGPGAAAWIVAEGASVLEGVLFAPDTTNNRMELLSVIEGLKSLKMKSGAVKICSDSQYVIKGMTEWIQGWKSRGWKNSQKEPVKNRDLWEQLDHFFFTHQDLKPKWVYVPGHSGIPGNERCDLIARSKIEGAEVALFFGKRENYPVDLSIIR